MSSVLSNYLGNAILAAYFPTSSGTYIALHVSDPTVTGSLASEVAGGDYIRQAAAWTAPSSKTTGLSAAVVFENLPACTVTHIAVWNAVANGSLLAYKSLTTPLAVVDSARLVIQPNDVAISL